MTISAVSTVVGTFGVAGGTTGSITTTGADLIVIGINYQNLAVANISDSKGNTWTAVRTEQVSAFPSVVAACTLYYCSNPTVGTGHTFTTTCRFVNVFVLAVSGARTATTPLDQQNGAATGAASVATGSITTSVSNCLVFTVFGAFNPGAAPTITSGGTGFTTPTGWSVPTATAEAGAAAYKIETTTATENVTWNSTGSPHATAIIASFMPPAVASTTGGFFMAFNN